MSQFRDTFTKGDKKDNLLDYDDSASLYFVSCILAVITIPWTLRLACHIFQSKRALLAPYFPEKSAAGSKTVFCKCTACVASRAERTAEVCSYSRRLMRKSVIIQLLCLSVLLSLLTYTMCSITTVEEIRRFDPFEILDIPVGTDDKAIKKAYRTMSLKYHPDKNLNDPTAAAKFMLISKAYQSLTDEIAKKNFEKYGNPDGPGVMKIGIGLPRLLVDERNQLPILCFFFTLLLVIIPLCFMCYYNHQRKYRNGVQLFTYNILSYKMSQATRCKHIPELLAASGESQDQDIRPTDTEDMMKVSSEVVEHVKRQHPKPIVIRNTLLVLAHLQRLHKLITPPLMKDLSLLLSKTLPITNAMLEVSLSHGWTSTIQSVIEFRRCIVQALDVQAHGLEQVPHCDGEAIKQLTRGKPPLKDLQQLVSNQAQVLSDTTKTKSFTEEQLKDVGYMLEHVSNMEVSGEIFVEDEKDVVVGDMATAKITLTRTQLKEGEAVGAVHAPLFPGVKFEEWICLLFDKRTGELQGLPLCCKSPERVIVERIKFQVQKPGPQTYTLAVMCDSYMGLDKTTDITFKVYTQQERPREIFVHHEDEELDDQPTLIQQLMGPAAEAQDSSDEEEEDEPNRTGRNEPLVEASSESE